MVSLKHKKISAVPDGGNSALVRPSDWNDEHDLLVSATDKLLGRASAGAGAAEEIPCTAFARTLLDDANAASARATLGVGGDVAATEQTSTSGTNIDFTGIPAGTRFIEILLDDVSLSGADHILVQLGDSGGIETSGYKSASSEASATSSTAGFVVRRGSAADAVSGIVTLVHSGGNKWISSHSCGYTNAAYVTMGGGSKTLSAELTQVRITRTGSNTFDLGSINIVYR